MASTIKVTNIDTPDGTGSITIDRPTVLQAGDIVTADLADDAVTIAKLAATGTASSSTFLRGDNAWAAAGGGVIVQVVNVQTGVAASGSTTMPADNTIPQNTEGNEFMTLAITPTSATNKLLIEVSAQVANDADTGQVLSSALFQDSTAGALASVEVAAETWHKQSINFKHYMTAGTTSATTFKYRAGKQSAGTSYFNSDGGTRIHGGVAASSITIWEIEV